MPSEERPDNPDGFPSPPELAEAVKRFLAEALQGDSASGPVREATLLYKFSTASQQKTADVVAACLSDWHSFVREFENGDREPMDLDDVVVLLIHRTYNRMRRQKYRDDQMNEQLAKGRSKTRDGEMLPFDPAMQPWRLGAVKNLEEEIAFILKDRSPRDRFIIELRYFAELKPKDIVQRVKAEMPRIPVSEAVVSRVLQRFADDLRPRVSDV
ncbi:MAG: hypothetical protein K2X38_24075 [Gemmataceae bacterium]|nr:hypothetical protein [Gemmataceae bacterium]